jgi:alkanesulfonate monooxygenase SsuD/methylene tetrahydromethanopterin reductase-like flavin-dependent oxidoreductase (luciferase family)
MQVFVELGRFAATATWAELRDMVRALEDAGAAGVSFSDHIFITEDDRPRAESVAHTCEPLTGMAVVAGMSDRLAMQTVVMNTAWIHPALLLRPFAQLAMLAGGRRVTAGLGAGWSAEEFDALGLRMPPFQERMDRFAEVVAFARDLFDHRLASLAGAHVTARQVPLSPPCPVSNQIWYAAFGDRTAIAEAERQLCRDWASLPARRLNSSPYLLLGEPAQIAEALTERHEAYGLDRISLTENTGIPAAPHDPIRFCQQVVPLLP